MAEHFIKFSLVGVIGLVVDIGVLKLCMIAFGMGPYTGRVVSFIAAATTTWLCNRVFTFRGHGGGPAHIEWMKFMLVSIGGFAFNYGTYAALIATQDIVARYPEIGVAAGSVAGLFFNFFASRRIVFRAS